MRTFIHCCYHFKNVPANHQLSSRWTWCTACASVLGFFYVFTSLCRLQRPGFFQSNALKSLRIPLRTFIVFTMIIFQWFTTDISWRDFHSFLSYAAPTREKSCYKKNYIQCKRGKKNHKGQLKLFFTFLGKRLVSADGQIWYWDSINGPQRAWRCALVFAIMQPYFSPSSTFNSENSHRKQVTT